MIGDLGEQLRQELEGVEPMGSGRGARELVGDEPNGVAPGLVHEPFEGDGGSGGVARQLQDAVGVVGLEPDAVVDVEAGVGPREHRAGVGLGEQIPTQELSQDGAAEGSVRTTISW